MSVVIGFLSGIISGMGIGGGAILIPALTLFYGIEQKLAQGINLVYFLPTAIIALVIHIKNKSADLKLAAVIGLCGTVGALGGSLAAMRINNSVLRRMFGIFLLFVGIREIMKSRKKKSGE